MIVPVELLVIVALCFVTLLWVAYDRITHAIIRRRINKGVYNDKSKKGGFQNEQRDGDIERRESIPQNSNIPISRDEELGRRQILPIETSPTPRKNGSGFRNFLARRNRRKTK